MIYKILIALSIFILFIIIALFSGHFTLTQRVIKEVHELFSAVDTGKTELLEYSDIAQLPEPVQRWIKHANVIGRPKVHSVRLKQKGLFRLGPDKEWIPFTAEEYYTIEKPAFLWTTKMKMAPLFTVAGRDRYFNGHGHMLIKLMSLIPVANATGDEIDQATLLRYLNEIMWFPSAAISTFIKWEPVDANTAKATMSYGGISASAVFEFNAAGELVNMIAQRFRFIDGAYQLDEWQTPISEYGNFNGVRIPTKGEGVWKLKAGDYSYIRLEITELEYNKPELYK